MLHIRYLFVVFKTPFTTKVLKGKLPPVQLVMTLESRMAREAAEAPAAVRLQLEANSTRMYRIGTMLRATITSHACRAFKSKIYADLIDHDPAMTLLELVHLRDVRAGELPYARMVHSRSDYLKGQKRVIATEDGLRYWCEPWEGIDVGFFADQRENRRALRALAAPGQRWLNLFGHTGAFSVALAAQGAQVVNVDVSKRYLQWTAENFALNDLNPELHVGVAGDARAYVAEGEDQFDGIIIDPPTAAQGKGEFWSVRKDFRALLARCFGRLRPGGVMLVPP